MRSFDLMGGLLVWSLLTACGGKQVGSEAIDGSGGAETSEASAGAGAQAGDGAKRPEIAFEELPAKYAAAICQALDHCVGANYANFLPGDDCLAAQSARADQLARLAPAIDAGTVRYHADEIQDCLDELVSSGCKALDSRPAERCRAAIEGTVADGDDCTQDAECAGASYCKLGDACPGTCTPRESVGGSCVATAQCASGSECDRPCLDDYCPRLGECTAVAQAGEPCGHVGPSCAVGLLCAFELFGDQPGACRNPAEIYRGKQGEACRLVDALCASPYVCELPDVEGTGKCVEKRESGAPCVNAAPSECPDDEACSLVTQRCTPKPKLGEACMLSDECAANLRCYAGVCATRPHIGEACSIYGCASGDCVENVCVTGNGCE
jgi:hypothetical protein